jgi:cyclophilin family peptidyl-prolyl cis-trans isomerase
VRAGSQQLVRGFVVVLPAALLLSCIPAVPPPEVTHPEGESDLDVTASAASATVFEGLSATVSAVASGGVPPYMYRWDQNAGPEDLALVDVTGSTLTTGPMTAPGRYVFRVVATDSEGFHATAFVGIQVSAAVTATAPRLAVAGEPVELSATVDSELEEVSLLWEVVRGDASFNDPTAANPTLTTTAGETVEVMLTATIPSGAAEPLVTTRRFEIVSVLDLRPRVLIETNFGEMTLELEGELAPLHAANFLQNVDEAFYDGLLFHRNACEPEPESGECRPFVLQGGGFERVDGELEEREPTHDPVPSESDNGLTNGEVYSVAMALRAGAPDSGATEFFINMKDNSFLDDQGFTVFGMIVEGIEVLDAIVAVETTDSPIVPGEQSLPVEDAIMEHVTRVGP